MLRAAHAEDTPAPRPAFRTGAPAAAAAAPAPDRLPTGKQRGYHKSLLGERAGLPAAEAIRAEINAKLAAKTLSFGDVSKAIDALKALPKNTASAPAATSTVKGGAHEDIADGYYAVPSLSGNNDLDFLLVSTEEKEGEWKGFRRVTRIVGGNNYYKVTGAARREALKAIREATYVADPREVTLDDGTPVTLPARDLTGPDAAALRYADEIGACRICNRNLTRIESRMAGIGPVCAGKG
jgi:hypothetical protein